jgi:DNA-directed RNA polymerase specialized sigma24 family protein
MNRNGRVARKASQRGAFQRIVKQAFGLRPSCRAVFFLCGIQGCTIDEAAVILGIAPGTAPNDRDRARRQTNARLRVGQPDRTQHIGRR